MGISIIFLDLEQVRWPGSVDCEAKSSMLPGIHGKIYRDGDKEANVFLLLIKEKHIEAQT